MKKNFMYALMSAIALTGAVGISSCSSSEDTADVNPTYDPVENAVTAQFVLNVSSAASTRQTSSAVQLKNNFRGMKDAKLIGLSTGKSSWLAPFAGSSSGYVVNKVYDLGTLYGTTEVDNTGTNNSSSSSRRVVQLTLPLQTDAMLVYGSAASRVAEDGTNTDRGNGKVIITMKNDATDTYLAPEQFTFDLVSLIGTKEEEYNQTCALAALILNRILKSEVEEAAVGTYTHKGKTNTEVLPGISWREIAKKKNDGENLPPLQENLASIFNSITTLGSYDVSVGSTSTTIHEIRAGSASAITHIIFLLYEALDNVITTASPTTEGELNAQRLAQEIKKRVDNYFDVEATEAETAFQNIGDGVTKNTIITGLISAHVYADKAAYEEDYDLVQHGDLMGFPTSFGLPLGAAQLYFTDFNADASTGGFSYVDPSTSLLDLNKTIAPSHYMYPSELLYFDNSSLYVSDVEKKDNDTDFPNGYNSWDTYSWTTNGWSNGAVASTTRSVAVKNNINYGVAMLKTKVTYDGSTFYDNRKALISSESNQELGVSDITKMKLTGIIIGGQNCQMGWNFLAKNNADAKWDYAIYDNQIVSGVIPTGEGLETYTMVFDNYNSTEQKDVLVALEFENNAKDFYGRGNLIRKGGKFYLIGKLALGTNTITSWPTKYAIPPYTAAGATEKVTRVFIQDFMTTATFKIGETSLQNAFITVPDLRSTQASLGLSVDLNWRTGIDFNNVVLGQ